MTQRIINIGTTVNDRSGDPLRTAFDKVNQNFTEIYNVLETGNLTELAQDYAAEMFVNGDHDGVTVVYDDETNKLNIIVDSTPIPSYISSGLTAPGSAVVANTSTVAVNFSDGIGTAFEFTSSGGFTFPDNSTQTTAYIPPTNSVGGTSILIADTNFMMKNELSVRVTSVNPSGFNVQINYSYPSTDVSIMANNGISNIFSGEITLLAANTNWYEINSQPFTTVGEMVSAMIWDASFHKVYRITVMMRDTYGSCYCIIEQLK